MSAVQPASNPNDADRGAAQSRLVAPPPAAAKAQLLFANISNNLPNDFTDVERTFAREAMAKIVKYTPGQGVVCSTQSFASIDSKKKVMLWLIDNGIILGYGLSQTAIPLVKLSVNDVFDRSVLNWTERPHPTAVNALAMAPDILSCLPKNFTQDERTFALKLMEEIRKYTPGQGIVFQTNLTQLDSKKKVLQWFVNNYIIFGYGLTNNSIPIAKLSANDVFTVPVLNWVERPPTRMGKLV